MTWRAISEPSICCCRGRVGQSVATWLGVRNSLTYSSPTMMLCKPLSRYYTVPPEIPAR